MIRAVIITLYFIFNLNSSMAQDTLMVQGTVQGMFYIPECMCAPFVVIDDSSSEHYALGTSPFESVAYQEFAEQEVTVTGVLSEYICEGFCDEVQSALEVISIELVEPDPQIGDECVTWQGEDGFLDCYLSCVPIWNYDNWLGDGWCDYSWGPTFDCLEFGYDCGDCNPDWDGTDPLGFCSDDCTIPGDTNNDGEVNVLDIINIICLPSDPPQGGCDPECFESADVNNDGSVNVLDIVMIVNIILEG